MTKPTNRKSRNLRRLIKSLIWGGSMALLGWALGFEPTWQLLVMVVAAMVMIVVTVPPSLSLAIDAKDWDAMGQLFTDTVYHDRTSLTGGEPTTLGVAEFVDGWRQTLQAMDTVHHQITNHVISLDGDEASPTGCRAARPRCAAHASLARACAA